MKKVFQISLIIASVIALSSCNKEYEDITSDKGFIGVFVRNQAGSISYYSETKNTITSDIYSTVNGTDLGDQLIAFSISGEKGFLLKGDGNDQKIETLDSETLKSEGEQFGFSNLTDLMAVSDTFVMVTQVALGSENSGSVIFLDSKNISKALDTLKVGNNPTRLAYSRGKKVYVANTGSESYPDSTVMVIDIDTKTVIDTVDLKLKKPIDMVLDAYQNLWVLCAGEEDQGAGLAKISYGTHNVTVFPFPNDRYVGEGRGGLSSGGGTIYFVNDGMYAMRFDDTVLPTKKFFTNEDYGNEKFNAIGISPNTGRFFCAKDGVDGAKDSVYIFDRYGFISSKEEIGMDMNPRQFVFVR